MAKKNNLMPLNTDEWLFGKLRLYPAEMRLSYLNMLCFMWDCVERGVMLKGSKVPYTKSEILQLQAIESTDEFWLDILVDEGFIGIRKSDGAYFSPQIVRAEEISVKRAEAGRKGGNATKLRAVPVVEKKPLDQEIEKPAEPVVEAPSAESLLPTDEAPPELTPAQKAKADKKKKYNYAEFVTLTRDEYSKLCEEYGEDPTKAMIDILNNYKGSVGKRYKSDYLTIRGWVKDKYFENNTRYGNKNNGGASTASQSTSQQSYFDTL